MIKIDDLNPLIKDIINLNRRLRAIENRFVESDELEKAKKIMIKNDYDVEG